MKALGEIVFAVLLAVLGIGFAVGGVRYGLATGSSGIGAGMIPFGAGALLAIFAFVRVIVAGRQWIAEVKIRKNSDVAKVSDGQGSSHVVLVVFALSLAAILLAPILGFLFSFALLVLVLTIIVERQKWWKGVLVSLVGTAVVWVVFIFLLNIPVPEGIFL